MPRLLLVLFFSCSCLFVACEPPPDAASDTVRTAVDVGIVVSDMQQALSFYQDVLGLPVVAEVNTSLIGKGRMVQLAHGTSLIKLVEFEEAPDGVVSEGIGKEFGYRYITLMVPDITPILDTIQMAELPIVLPATELGNGAVIAMVEDPDGNIVEFVQEAK